MIERNRKCPDCGSVEGSDPTWRYVAGHYEHRCSGVYPGVGHWVPDYRGWVMIAHEAEQAERKEMQVEEAN